MSDSPDSPDELATAAKETGVSAYAGMRDTILTGVAITVPLVVTLYVLTVALDFITEALGPFIRLLRWLGIIQGLERVELISLLIDAGVYSLVIDFLTELIAIAILLGVVVLVGTVGRNRYGERIIDMVDLGIASIPGIGTVYKSFRRMGDVMLDETGENFQDVKLVECFGGNVYVLGFRTSDSPPTIEETAGHEEMVSMFLPLAPNPVTGGFLTYIPEDDVHDIDMTIEEGVRSILTSGIATGEGAQQHQQITMGDLESVTDFQRLQDAVTPEASADGNDGGDGRDGGGPPGGDGKSRDDD